MLKILWKRGKIAPEEQFLRLSTLFCYLMLDFYVKRGIRFSLRDKRLFEITEVEITRVDCIICVRLSLLSSEIAAPLAVVGTHSIETALSFSSPFLLVVCFCSPNVKLLLVRDGPEVIKLFSCSTQLSMKF